MVGREVGMAELKARALALVQRLRTPRVTHHQISREGEEYATATKTRPVETIKLEAADVIEQLLDAHGVPDTSGDKTNG
jgi:hypothetical protein